MLKGRCQSCHDFSAAQTVQMPCLHTNAEGPTDGCSGCHAVSQADMSFPWFLTCAARAGVLRDGLSPPVESGAHAQIALRGPSCRQTLDILLKLPCEQITPACAQGFITIGRLQILFASELAVVVFPFEKQADAAMCHRRQSHLKGSPGVYKGFFMTYSTYRP